MPAAMSKLATTTLASGSTTVTFSNIPSSYRDLRIVITASADNYANFWLAFNGDNGFNYNYRNAYTTSSTGAVINTDNTSVPGLQENGSFYTTKTILSMDIFDYAQTNKHKSYLSRFDNADSVTNMISGRWASTAAITSITFQVNSPRVFAATSTFSLYGIVS
jgi:hypothetical protein